MPRGVYSRHWSAAATRSATRFVRTHAVPFAKKHAKSIGHSAVAAGAALAKRFYRAATASRPSRSQRPPRRLGRFVEANPGSFRADIGAGGELTVARHNIAIGSKSHLDSKLIKAARNDTYYRFQTINQFMNTTATSTSPGVVTGGGAYALVNQRFGNTIGLPSSLYLPLHVYDLTAMNNLQNGSYIYATPAWQPQLNGTLAAGTVIPATTVGFSSMANTLCDGSATSYNLQLERSKVPTTQPIEECLQEYASVDLLAYGASQMATEWSIKIFQLKDDHFHPYELSLETNPSTAVYDEAQGACAFWEAFASKSFKHPLAKTSCEFKKHVKLLKEITFVQQPRLTTESDANLGHAKHMKIFLPMFRKNNYKWLDPAQDPNILNVNSDTPQAGFLSAYLKPKARIYMSIQATNVSNTVYPINNNISYTPTYDISIRTKFTDLSS